MQDYIQPQSKEQQKEILMEINCNIERETAEWMNKKEMESRGFEEDLTDFILATHQWNVVSGDYSWRLCMTSLEIIPMSNSVASTIWKSQEAEVGMVTPLI